MVKVIKFVLSLVGIFSLWLLVGHWMNLYGSERLAALYADESSKYLISGLGMLGFSLGLLVWFLMDGIEDFENWYKQRKQRKAEGAAADA